MQTHPPLRRLIACIMLPCYLLACSRKRVPGNEVSIPLSDIERVAVRGTDVGMTIGLTFVVLGFVGAVAFIATCSDPQAWC
jgi:hypothetical protein